MFDILIQKTCDHKIFDERLSIQGASPNYFAILNYVSNKDSSKVEVRDFAATDGLTGYSYQLNGISNWSLSTDGRQINFNSLGLGGLGTGVASFVDGSTLISPTKVYLATYYALDTTCPMHEIPGNNASPIQKDINIGPSGQFALATGADKVRQAVVKALLTAVGSNSFHSTYGSWLSSTIGQKLSIYTQFTIQQSIQDAVDFLIQQQQQSTTYIPPEEMIFRVSNVNVSSVEGSPTALQVTARVLTGAYQEVEISLGVNV